MAEETPETLAEEMTVEQAMATVARHAAWAAITAEEDQWGMYPEIGLNDWLEIQKVRDSLVTPPTPEEYDEAYALLEKRAEPEV